MTVIKPLKVGTVFLKDKEYWVVVKSYTNYTPFDSVFYLSDCKCTHSCKLIYSKDRPTDIKNTFFEKDLKRAKYISDIKKFKVKHPEYFI